jgi:hypothetical protein
VWIVQPADDLVRSGAVRRDGDYLGRRDDPLLTTAARIR